MLLILAFVNLAPPDPHFSSLPRRDLSRILNHFVRLLSSERKIRKKKIQKSAIYLPFPFIFADPETSYFSSLKPSHPSRLTRHLPLIFSVSILSNHPDRCLSHRARFFFPFSFSSCCFQLCRAMGHVYPATIKQEKLKGK